MRQASRSGSDVLLTVATNGVIALLGLATGILAARILGPQGRGELAAIQLWPNLLASIAMLGLPEALVYFTAREPAHGGGLLGSAMALAALSSVPFAGVGYVLMPHFLSEQPMEVVTAARWYLCLIPLYALVGLPYQPLRGMGDFVAWNALRIAPSLGWLLVLLAGWISGSVRPESLAGSYLVILALLFFPVIAVVARRVPSPFWPDLRRWTMMVGYGLPSMASGIPKLLSYRVDQMVLAAFVPPGLLGLYVVAVAWGGMSSPLLQALAAVLFPRIAAQANAGGQIQLFARGIRVSVLLATGLAGIVGLVTPWLLPAVFGDAYRPAIPAALVLLLVGAMAGINGVLGDAFRGLGRPAGVLWAEMVGFAAAVGAAFSLVEDYGIMGTALASLLGALAATLTLTLQAAYITSSSMVDLFRPNAGDVLQTWRQLSRLLGGFSGQP